MSYDSLLGEQEIVVYIFSLRREIAVLSRMSVGSLENKNRDVAARCKGFLTMNADKLVAERSYFSVHYETFKVQMGCPQLRYKSTSLCTACKSNY